MRVLACILLCCIVLIAAETPGDSQQVRVGLTLSAGGAFGLAHIGCGGRIAPL